MVFISVHMLTLRSRWMWDNWLKLRKQFCAYFHADLMIHKIMFLYQTLQSHTSLTRFHYQFSPFNQAFVIICDDFSEIFFLLWWELKRIPYGDSIYLWFAIFIQNLLWRWEILNGQLSKFNFYQSWSTTKISIFKGKHSSSGTCCPHGIETSPCGHADNPTSRSISA